MGLETPAAVARYEPTPMSSEKKSEVWYRKWFRKVRKTWRPALIGLNLPPPPPKQPPDRPASPELVPGNYFNFEFFIELTLGGVAHLGYPAHRRCCQQSPALQELRGVALFCPLQLDLRPAKCSRRHLWRQTGGLS
jgi:hypothetical protein